jgi:hypothetical protein
MTARRGAIAFALLLAAHGAARAQVVEDPPGCLAATAHTNGPCKLTYPNGNTIATGADGRTWVKLHNFGDFKFEVGQGMAGTITGVFRTLVIVPLPSGDAIVAPQSEMMDIEADCRSRQYRVQGTTVTDPNGFYTGDLGAEDFARRVLPGSPMETVLRMICATPKPPQDLINQEEALNEKCRGGSGDNPKTLKACDARDALLGQIEAKGWCYGHAGQAGYERDWEQCKAH